MFCKIFNISIPYFCSLNIYNHKIWKRWTFTTLYFHLYLFDAKETQYRFSKSFWKWYQTFKFDLHRTKSESQSCLIHITNKNEYSISIKKGLTCRKQQDLKAFRFGFHSFSSRNSGWKKLKNNIFTYWI